MICSTSADCRFHQPYRQYTMVIKDRSVSCLYSDDSYFLSVSVSVWNSLWKVLVIINQFKPQQFANHQWENECKAADFAYFTTLLFIKWVKPAVSWDWRCGLYELNLQWKFCCQVNKWSFLHTQVILSLSTFGLTCIISSEPKSKYWIKR